MVTFYNQYVKDDPDPHVKALIDDLHNVLQNSLESLPADTLATLKSRFDDVVRNKFEDWRSMTPKHRPDVWHALTPRQVCDVILWRLENCNVDEVLSGHYAKMMSIHMNRKDF